MTTFERLIKVFNVVFEDDISSDAIKLDAIPKKFLNSTQNKAIDRPLTEMEKAIILESVNNALANPYKITQSQYTVAPQ